MKKMKDYIKAPKKKRVACLVVFLIMLALVAVGAVTAGSDNKAKAVRFDPRYENQYVYTYIDIVAVSDWVYKYDDSCYYAAIDKRGDSYTVKLSDSQFESLSAQNDFWNDTDEDAVPPKSVRLYGNSWHMSEEEAECFAPVWGLNSAQDYYRNYGDCYFDATSSPGLEHASLFWLIAMAVFFVWIILASATWNPGKAARKTISRLKKRQMLDAAARDFECAQALTKDDSLRFGNEFIFRKGRGEIIAYRDILWCYRFVSSPEIPGNGRRAVITNPSVNAMVAIIVHTSLREKIVLCGIGSSVVNINEELERQIYAKIQQANPGVLMGCTPENAVEYEKRIGK